MSDTKSKAIIVVGPTASGKTGLAIEIAKKYRGEVISADSRQIYRKLNIGTAKISKEEMCGVTHHLIDINDIDTIYTAADFKRDATKAIKEIQERGNVPVIAGGTFFYIDTLLGHITPPAIEPDYEFRKKFEHRSTEELFKELSQKDPRRAADIDQHNKRRLIRALEIIDAIGTVPPLSHTSSAYHTLCIGISTDKEDLRKNLRSRGEEWLESGFIEEIENLLAENVARERLEEIGFEYQIGLSYLDGALTKEKFIEVFEQKNWQYAKRQLTWLKRNKSINWVSLSDRSEIDLLVKQFLLQD